MAYQGPKDERVGQQLGVGEAHWSLVGAVQPLLEEVRVPGAWGVGPQRWQLLPVEVGKGCFCGL